MIVLDRFVRVRKAWLGLQFAEQQDTHLGRFLVAAAIRIKQVRYASSWLRLELDV